MKKKFLFIILCGVMILGLTGCGSKNELPPKVLNCKADGVPTLGDKIEYEWNEDRSKIIRQTYIYYYENSKDKYSELLKKCESFKTYRTDNSCSASLENNQIKYEESFNYETTGDYNDIKEQIISTGYTCE